jgi:hypothetical protein
MFYRIQQDKFTTRKITREPPHTVQLQNRTMINVNIRVSNQFILTQLDSSNLKHFNLV